MEYKSSKSNENSSESTLDRGYKRDNIVTYKAYGFIQ